MSALAEVATLLLAATGGLFMAWTIGAGSSGSTPFAPAVGANAISVMRAGFIVGILGFLGAVLQGANVTGTIGGDLIRGVTLSPMAAIVGLFTASLLVAIGVFTGYPIATAFTVTGAVTGVGLALGGSLNWIVYRDTVALWVLTPFLGGGGAYATARILRSQRISSTAAIGALVGFTTLILANVQFTVLGPPGKSQSIATVLALKSTTGSLQMAAEFAISVGVALAMACYLGNLHRRAPERTEQRVLLLLGGLVAFSAGGTQVGLAVGPLIPLIETYRVPLVALLVGGGGGLLLGSWMGAPRLIKALARDYSALGPKRSIAALVPSFVIAQVAVFLGVPVSFNEIIVSAIVGSGFVADRRPVDADKIRNTIFGWISSLGIAAAISYIGAISLLMLR